MSLWKKSIRATPSSVFVFNAVPRFVLCYFLIAPPMSWGLWAENIAGVCFARVSQAFLVCLLSAILMFCVVPSLLCFTALRSGNNTTDQNGNGFRLATELHTRKFVPASFCVP